MKVLVSARGPDMTAPVEPRFGRAPSFVLVNADTGEWSAYVNPGAGLGQGAGIEAARLAAEVGAQVVITGATGPNAFKILAAAGIAVYLVDGGRVADAVDNWKAGKLTQAETATEPAHPGVGAGPGTGRGAGGGRRGPGGGRGAGGAGGGGRGAAGSGRRRGAV